MYSRREFGKVALAGIPLSTAFAKINSEFGGVRVGVQSYGFRDRSLDEAIAAMMEIGIGHYELCSGHVEPNMRTPGRTRGRVAAAEAARVAAVHAALGMRSGAQEIRRRGSCAVGLQSEFPR